MAVQHLTTPCLPCPNFYLAVSFFPVQRALSSACRGFPHSVPTLKGSRQYKTLTENTGDMESQARHHIPRALWDRRSQGRNFGHDIHHLFSPTLPVSLPPISSVTRQIDHNSPLHIGRTDGQRGCMSILGPHCPEHVRTGYDPQTVQSVCSFIPHHLNYPLSRAASQAQECRPRCSLRHHFPGARYSSTRMCAFPGQVPHHKTGLFPLLFRWVEHRQQGEEQAGEVGPSTYFSSGK